MSVYSQTFVVPTTDALFRTWGKFISDSLTSLGWGKTADTGQIDWTTVTRAVGASTSQGYEIRKSSASKTDIYIKVEYGSGYNNNCPGLWITAGTASNGSGTLTGTTTSRFVATSAQGASAGKTEIEGVSGNAGRLCVMGFETDESQVTYGSGFLVQRTTDADGTDNTTGFAVMSWGYGVGGVSTQYVEFTAGAGTYDATGGYQMLRVTRVRQTPAAPILFPGFWSGINTMPVIRDALVAPLSSAHFGTVHTISHMGSNRAYISVYATTNTNAWGYTSPENFTLLVRWE